MITNLIYMDMFHKRRRLWKKGLQSNHSWNLYYIMKVKETPILRIKKEKRNIFIINEQRREDRIEKRK